MPEVRYAHRSGRAIAYQVFGTAGVDFLNISEWAANSDSIWEHPGHLRMWRYHASLGRVVRFDRSGIGASDPPVGNLDDVHEWAADGVAVLDEIGAKSAVIAGEGWGGQAAIVMAVMYPERVDRLVLVNSYACMVKSEEYPEGISDADVARSVDLVRSYWGTGNVLAQSVPSLAADYADLCGRYERASASPVEAAHMVQAAFQSDVRHLTQRVECPTLVVYTGDNRYISAQHSRYLADHIPGADLVSVRADTYYDLGSVFSTKYLEFLTGAAEVPWSERELAVVAFTDIVESTSQLAHQGDREWKAILDNCAAVVDREVRRAGGRVVKQTGDGHVLTFASPGAAISALLGIQRGARVLGVSLRCGVHMGEVETRADSDIAGIVVHTAARIMGVASADEIIVSRVVHDLVAGAGIEFDDRGSHELKGLPAAVQVFAVRV